MLQHAQLCLRSAHTHAFVVGFLRCGFLYSRNRLRPWDRRNMFTVLPCLLFLCFRWLLTCLRFGMGFGAGAQYGSSQPAMSQEYVIINTLPACNLFFDRRRTESCVYV